MARAAATGTMLAMTLLLATPARANFHFWNIREVYTDASGTNQFIEFVALGGGQQFVNGQSITVTPSGGGSPKTIMLSGNLPGDSANKAFIVGTVGITNFGAPKPDYLIPTNFVAAGGGTISFFGQNSGPYTALPTDGVLSRTWGNGNAVNSPQNFADQTGTITIPPVNSPPFVLITNPLNNALFPALGTVLVGISATDNVSVASVQLLTNGVAAATNAVAPFGFTLSNLVAGTYSLRARAQDNQALAATSAPISVRVADRPTLAFARGSNGPIQFQFNSASGVDYVVDRGTLTNFSPVVTNAGSGGVLQFSETNSSPTQRTYRVRLQ